MHSPDQGDAFDYLIAILAQKAAFLDLLEVWSKIDFFENFGHFFQKISIFAKMSKFQRNLIWLHFGVRCLPVPAARFRPDLISL